MDEVMEYAQWFLILAGATVAIVGYLLLTQLMEQIDMLEDRLSRLAAGREQAYESERIRSWRERDRPIKPSLKDKPL